ncbi:MAG: hypothetical protein IPL28_14215 [Chloroflexi bacterium]|nr:hypothetical protein [Chloroflexota bacterium]
MNRLVSILLWLTLALGLMACGRSEAVSDDTADCPAPRPPTLQLRRASRLLPLPHRQPQCRGWGPIRARPATPLRNTAQRLAVTPSGQAEPFTLGAPPVC